MTPAARDLQPSPAAEKMADSLRAGTSARLAWLDDAPRDADAVRLEELGDLSRSAMVARPTLMAPAVRAARRMLQVLLRPLTAAQTSFNREMARHVLATAHAARQLDRRLTAVEDALRALGDRVKALEDFRGDPGVPVPAGEASEVDAMRRLFVHSRLPPPPARVLCVGASAMAADLAQLGFDVVLAAGGAAPPDRIRGVVCRVGRGGLPFVTGSFSAVLLLEEIPRLESTDVAAGLAEELVRVLRAEGRLLVTAPHLLRALLACDRLSPLEVIGRGAAQEVEVVHGDPESAPDRAVGAVFLRADRHVPAG